MRTIIAGSREFNSYPILLEAIKQSGFEITRIISGMARGADTLAVNYAKAYSIPYDEFPVLRQDWELHGKSAGMIRNTNMADHADALIAIWDGKSPGTKNMISIARKKGLKVFVWRTDLGRPEYNHPVLF